MTRNQLQFHKNVEDRRHNLVAEQLGAREAATKETQAQASLTQAGAAMMQAAVAGRRADIEQQKADVAQKQGKAKLIIEGIKTGVEVLKEGGKLAASAKTIS